jgi:hypothetical protein
MTGTFKHITEDPNLRMPSGSHGYGSFNSIEESVESKELLPSELVYEIAGGSSGAVRKKSMLDCKYILKLGVVVLSCLCIAGITYAPGESTTFVERAASFFHNTVAAPSIRSASSSSSQPNVIFVLADDMGYGSLSQNVSTFLVGLRDAGINLENYYAQQSCTPSRAALMTGRYPIRLGLATATIADDTTAGLPLNETTIAQMMKDNGYTTYMLGKWNLGNRSPRYLPTARGFDYFLGYMNALNNYWSKLDPDHTTFHDFMYSDQDCYYMYDSDDLKHYSTHLYREWALDFIENHDFESSPMFMYLAFQAVHDPFADNDDTFPDGIPDDYLSNEANSYIENNVAVRVCLVKRILVLLPTLSRMLCLTSSSPPHTCPPHSIISELSQLPSTSGRHAATIHEGSLDLGFRCAVHSR